MVDDLPAADGHGDSGGHAPAVEGSGPAQGAESAAVDEVGTVQVQYRQIGGLPFFQGAAGQTENLPGVGAQGVQNRFQRHDAGFHQIRVQDGEGGLQPHDAVETAPQALGFLLGAVGSMV